MNIAILVGGRGKRLGYIEKPMLKICGKEIIKRIVSKFHDCNLVIVCRDYEQSLIYSKFSKTIIDEFKNIGPISGIYSALNYFKDLTLVIGGDMPFVKRDLAEFIYNFAKKVNIDAVIPYWGADKYEPLLACYSPSALPQLKKCIIKGERKISSAILQLKKISLYPVERLKEIDNNLISFLNINTLDDLKRAEKICSSIDLEEV